MSILCIYAFSYLLLASTLEERFFGWSPFHRGLRVHPNPPIQSVVKQDSESTAAGEAACDCVERSQALRELRWREAPHQQLHHIRSVRVPELSTPTDSGAHPEAERGSLFCSLIPTRSPHTRRNDMEIPVFQGERSQSLKEKTVLSHES